MNILITGGAGFIGSHLADNLIKKGENIVIVDNYFSFAENITLKWCWPPVPRYTVKVKRSP